ncbi:DNA helicase [Oceaniferula spumae]|uniref:DNA helicase n=1 Tax=Oceaniferula spumae TaxID=2979115 RepID=A0AAT9FM37_9BACT
MSEETNIPEIESLSFRDFQSAGEDKGGFETDDALSALLPLMQEVLQAHDRGMVAPLSSLDDLKVTHGHVWYHAGAELKPSNSRSIRAVEGDDRGEFFDVVDRRSVDADLNEGTLESTNKRIWSDDTAPPQPCYVTHYRSWEHLCGQHDALTDIFSLGMLLAALATGLDLATEEGLETFADGRDSIHSLCPRLHPVVASAILRMTELRRSDRVQDLRILISYLKNYRDQKPTDDLNLINEPGFVSAPLNDRRQMIHAKLRDRLFEVNKRNRLIHFRPTMQTVNLTVSSVPTMLDYRNIRPEQLFTWQDWLADSLAKEKEIPLNRYLRFEDAAYLPNSLDTIRRDANRDRKEYGFAQLRLVIAFFRWHNLKEDKNTRIHSPLLLHPVELVKKKGVRDSWHLQAVGSVAEVNPVLRHYLKQLYNLDLPEAIDLQETSVDSLYEALKKQINASEPAVEVKKLDRPRIDLIYETARKRLDKFLHRRKLSGRSVRSYDSLSYSYKRNNFQPLGLQIFLHRVQHTELPLEHLVRDRPAPRMPQVAAAPTMEKKRESYSLREGSEENPYVWDFDLCSLTLGNFNYRKMSLVRDYNTLLEQERPNNAFDEVFSLLDDEVETPEVPELPMDEQHLIVAADPTQVSAIAAARSGQNLIIQGPPGTGKSQTITNLITNYVAEGKRVLFVCEKRAALDVVYHRLASQGLDRVTCLIHDSQADKKSFIHDLRDTYEAFTSDAAASNSLEAQASDACKTAQRELEVIERFAEAMSSRRKDGSYSVEELLERLLSLGGKAEGAGDDESLPGYEEWVEHGPTVRRLGQALDDIDLGNIYAATPFKFLKNSCYNWENPVASLKAKIAQAQEGVSTAHESSKDFAFSTTTCSLDELLYLSFVAESARFLARRNLLGLLDPNNQNAQDFASFVKNRDKQFKQLEKAQQHTKNWRIKIEPSEVDAALAQATALENSALKFFQPKFWKLRKIMRGQYNFSAHTIAPSWSDILSKLRTEYQEADQLRELEDTMSDSLGVTELDQVREKVEEFVARRSAVTVDREDDTAFYQSLLKEDDQTRATVETLASMQEPLRQLSSLLDEFVMQPGGYLLPELLDVLSQLEKSVSLLPEILPELLDLSDASAIFHETLRTREFTPDDFERHCAAKSLELAYREDRSLKRFEGWILRRHSKRIRHARDHWMSLNGERTVDRVRRNFRTAFDTASKPAAQLSEPEKEAKKIFNRGRRELEHEFSKTMRYRSIRDLSSGDSGKVLNGLKPIWLMSPLSISDTIALGEVDFDVVLFDEASQIRLEEAVPAIYRAEQVIVVGDEMQLPPTDFFASKGDDDNTLIFEDEDEQEEYDLGADSFLSHAERSLSSTMLGWHYRSHFESLISFSNRKFYHGKLLTIPDLLADSGKNTPLSSQTGEDAPDHSEEILSRSISFPFQHSAVYENRKNSQEAYYIAHQVRGILARNTGLSIGIVAFSEAQQNEIDSALTRLADEDETFRTQLADEVEREEDGQFCGLFVKNLENVQGDERDIMILSICYGPDAKGKMRMNFGPINRTGGEKRLNVIFSRAKKHMVIVSSIRSNAITNDYNDGARCLKQFLEYAEAVCTGNDAAARRVLGISAGDVETASSSALSQTLRSALIERGYHVDSQVGQSNFRCDLALRHAGEENYQLGILLVDSETSENVPIIEQYVLRPSLLESFGWRVLEVLAKDWHDAPDEVLEKIDRLMTDPHADLEESPDEDPEPTVEAEALDEILPEPETDPISEGETTSLIHGEDGNVKFWTIQRVGNSITVHFGKQGTNGQTRERSHDTESKAITDYNRAIRQKKRKGYTENH